MVRDWGIAKPAKGLLFPQDIDPSNPVAFTSCASLPSNLTNVEPGCHSLNPYPLPPVLPFPRYPCTYGQLTGCEQKCYEPPPVLPPMKTSMLFLLLPVWYRWDCNLACRVLGVANPWHGRSPSSLFSAEGELSADQQPRLGLHISYNIGFYHVWENIYFYLFVTDSSINYLN